MEKFGFGGNYIMWIAIGIIGGLIVICTFAYFIYKSKKQKPGTQVEVKKEEFQALVQWAQVDKQQKEEEQRSKDLKKADMKQKLEVFKQTKDQLKDKLKSQLNTKEWQPLESILKSADKGSTGIYVIYNKTKNKYYVGQAKQLFKRVRDHFLVEEMAKDFMTGDNMQVKFLTANELDDSYRLDHVEKTGIELFESDKDGYNKTTGNL